MPYTYSVTSRSQAGPGLVFAALVRAGTWPRWSPIDAAEIEGGADPDEPQRVGDVRVFRMGRGVARERVTELVADRRLGYVNVTGPFRTYRGTVELAGTPDGGTDITWSAIFEPKVPLTGPFWRWYLTRFMGRMAAGLAAYAGAEGGRRST